MGCGSQSPQILHLVQVSAYFVQHIPRQIFHRFGNGEAWRRSVGIDAENEKESEKETRKGREDENVRVVRPPP